MNSLKEKLKKIILYSFFIEKEKKKEITTKIEKIPENALNQIEPIITEIANAEKKCLTQLLEAYPPISEEIITLIDKAKKQSNIDDQCSSQLEQLKKQLDSI